MCYKDILVKTESGIKITCELKFFLLCEVKISMFIMDMFNKVFYINISNVQHKHIAAKQPAIQSSLPRCGACC